MSDALEEVQKTWIGGNWYGYVEDNIDEILDKTEAGPRYYIHHHGEGLMCRKDARRRKGADSLVNSTRTLTDLWKNDNLEIVRPTKLRHVQSTPHLVRLQLTKKEKAKIDPNMKLHLPSGHVMIPATCTKNAALCEGCRKSVFRTRYLYCRDCPIVLHNNPKCKEKLLSRCPAPELGIFGWGEGKAEPRKLMRQVFDLNDVYLKEPHNDNKCGGCGCILDLKLGHHRPSDAQPHIRGPKTFRGPFKSIRRGIHRLLHGKNEEKLVVPKLQCARKYFVCHFTKKYYCENCFWGDEWYIPADMIHVNDFNKQPVCRAAYLKLRVLWDTAVVAVPPEWFTDTEYGKNFFEVRRKLKEIIRYINVCNVAQSMRRLLDDLHAPHLLECRHLLRMSDLYNIVRGDIYNKLLSIEKNFEEHIKQCSMCLSINRRCAGCRKGEPLLYFDENVKICEKCDQVFHKDCIENHECDD